VHPAVGDLLCPGGEELVQLVEALDPAVGGLGEEGLPDVGVEPLLLSPALRLTGQSEKGRLLGPRVEPLI
jgi:hypothetical protein